MPYSSLYNENRASLQRDCLRAFVGEDGDLYFALKNMQQFITARVSFPWRESSKTTCIHTTIIEGCEQWERSSLRRTDAVLTRAKVGCVPVAPVMFGVRLLVVAVVLRCLAEELCKGRDVHGSRSHQLPFAAGMSCLDHLQQPSRCRLQDQAVDRARLGGGALLPIMIDASEP